MKCDTLNITLRRTTVSCITSIWCLILESSQPRVVNWYLPVTCLSGPSSSQLSVPSGTSTGKNLPRVSEFMLPTPEPDVLS